MVIRVLLVDDHASFRQPLAFMLEREPGITIVGQAGTIADARTIARGMGSNGGIDVALVDLQLPDGDGVELVRHLQLRPSAKAGREAKVLVLTGTEDRLRLARAVEAGAAGVLHKSVSTAEIIAAIKRLHAGEELLSAREMVDLLRLAGRRRDAGRVAQAALATLTPRERQVLQSLADGLADREIAEHFHISHETVRTHMVNILRKLGVESRLQALVFAIRHGAVEISSFD